MVTPGKNTVIKEILGAFMSIAKPGAVFDLL
jgi:hypothetical protein